MKNNCKSKKTKSVVFLGIDGSGKSTLSKNVSILLSANLNVALISDKLEYYEAKHLIHKKRFFIEKIRNVIGSYAKKAKSLKLYKIPKLIELLIRDRIIIKIKKRHYPDFIVLDGSPLLNLTAWSILYKEEFFNETMCLKVINILTSLNKDIRRDDQIFKIFPELSVLKRLGLAHLNMPDIVIFLDVEPEIALSRIETRERKKQVHETIEKLAKLRTAYSIMCKAIKNNMNITTYILPGNDTIRNITNKTITLIKSN